MRFIGSKRYLLKDIKEIIDEKCDGAQSFCDIFSGTAVVSRFFKNDFKIISNDLLHFSYMLQKATIENNTEPNFRGLQQVGIDDPLQYLNGIKPSSAKMICDPFIFQNYAPNHTNTRYYFTKENALKIDLIRQTINDWRDQELIGVLEYTYLIAALIEAVPFVSNIAGTYGAYLKHWDKRAFKNLELLPFEIINNGFNNESHNTDANELISQISGDILYVDPPYNTRQYLPNYHILETISRYDQPVIKGKTGIREYSNEKSKYCSRTKVLDEFRKLVRYADFKYIIVSYSSEGLMGEEDIRDALLKYGEQNSYSIKKLPYRRYKHTKGSIQHNLHEYLFFIRKK